MKFSNTLTRALTKALIGLILSAGLMGCTSAPVKVESATNVNWQQQQKLQSQLLGWSINGRISIQTELEGGQADYSWQQQSLSHYNIRLQAPMGAGTTLINGRENGVTVKTSAGDELFDTDVDQLMRRINGWPLPVSGLQYWVRGLPAPGSLFEISQWKESGMPAVMLQDGWRIEFRKYKSMAANASQDYHLPGKLFINRIKDDEEVDVRLIIRHWTISDSNVKLNNAQVQ